MAEIDREALADFLELMLPAVRAYMAEPPPSQTRPLTVLNALAITAASVLAAVPPDARDWFDAAVDGAVTDMRAQFEESIKKPPEEDGGQAY